MDIGIPVGIGQNLDQKFAELKSMGMHCCQLGGGDPSMYTDELAQEILTASQKHGVRLSSYWCGWPGPMVWDFYEGQLTLGLVPPAYRYKRLEHLLAGSDFAKKLGIADMITHAGYIPESPYDENYAGTVAALRVLAKHCKENRQYFLFETGQETPITLLRAMEDIGTGNLGVNLDPANLLMYGKANPVDALDIIGIYVRAVHAKDGHYPTNGRELGEEVPLGEGRVDFPRLIAKLKELGYKGDLIIEREIKGPEQIRDILKAKELLEKLI
jgi:sugar phosphate isomerase/epimerase